MYHFNSRCSQTIDRDYDFFFPEALSLVGRLSANSPCSSSCLGQHRSFFPLYLLCLPSPTLIFTLLLRDTSLSRICPCVPLSVSACSCNLIYLLLAYVLSPSALLEKEGER